MLFVFFGRDMHCPHFSRGTGMLANGTEGYGALVQGPRADTRERLDRRRSPSLNSGFVSRHWLHFKSRAWRHPCWRGFLLLPHKKTS